MRRAALAFGGIALLLAAAGGCGSPPGGDDAAVATLQEDAAASGFARAYAPRPLVFPADHGAHRDFRHEWWYVTGNLDAPGGRRFGFQITFFRYGLTARPLPRRSRWAAAELYMAHFAVTDVANRRFRAYQRRGRGALGLAGARLAPFRVWLDDWRLESFEGDELPWALAVREGDLALRLLLRNTKPPVLQGEAGLSRKSAEPGNASYYYSATRLQAEGMLEVAGESFPVSGLAWLDREWSSSALAADQAGWDWFSLQFDDATELMYYRLRRKDGSADPHSAGSLVAADGAKTPLRPEDVELKVLDRWRTPDGAWYPARWSLAVKPLGKTWLIHPVVADQELREGSFRYWEGAVDVFPADRPDRPAGRGYLEMTGYAAAVRPGAGERR
jgi:predicted secreted hydrolase